MPPLLLPCSRPPRKFISRTRTSRSSARCRQDLERATFVRSALDQFEKLAAGGRLEPAAALLAQALQTYPTDPALLSAQVRLRLEQQKAKLLERLNEAKAAVGRMEYKRAIEIVASLTPSLVAVPELAGEVQALEQEARFRDRQADFWAGMPSQRPTKGFARESMQVPLQRWRRPRRWRGRHQRSMTFCSPPARSGKNAS